MTLKLLCIDPLEDYELIDRTLLSSNGIETVYVYKTAFKVNTLNPHVVIDVFNYEELYRICELIKPDYIVCSSELLFLTIARVRSELGINGMNIVTAELLSNKHLMYKQLKDFLPCPQTVGLTELSSFSALNSLFKSSEIFIKPVNMAGSCETYHVKNNEDYDFFLVNQKTGLTNYIAQPYINAELYHSELVLFNGDVLFISARQYSLPNHLMVSRNEPIFSLNITDSETHQKIVSASLKVAELLNINNGILHTEFFLDKQGEIYFIETNARAPGIGLNRMYRKKLSISLETLLCFIVCGIAPPQIIEHSDYYICGYYPLKKGVVKKIKYPKLNVKSKWIAYVKPGDSFEIAKHMTKSAMVMCWDTSLQKITNAGRKLVGHELIQMD